MRRGTRSTAAGRPIPGTSPILAPSIPSHFGTEFHGPREIHPDQCQRHHEESLSRPLSPSHHAPISNRHLVRLEFTATRPESTTSIFLIDPSSHVCVG